MSTGPSSSPLLTSIYQCSPEFLGELKLWIEQAGVAIPVNQLVGFAGFTGQNVKVNTLETTSSTTYVDLATVGPQFTNLRPGKYVFWFGCSVQAQSVNDTAVMALSFNGAAPVEPDDYVFFDAQTGVLAGSMSTITTFTDPNGSTVKAKYRTNNGNGIRFQDRWLVALKYA